MTDAIRTVVLARAGTACDRVVEGLTEAGAELVATLDPSQHAPDALEALAPAVLVVVLDPVDEDALEPFEPAFAVPGRTVFARMECYRLGRRIAFVRGTAHQGLTTNPIAHAAGTFALAEQAPESGPA